MIGTTLSHFRITAKLGEGGMGEVYRAEDTKLGREVAIKVLPEAVASDPERLARFEREAKVLASLNHPHIAAIHAIESAEPTGRPWARLASQEEGDAPTRPVHFLVMELAEGEDLAARIGRGPVPVEEALPIALQITQALEAAHEKGIVHRDLKPANVKVDGDGNVKVLDFGLAKAMDPAVQVSGDDGIVSPRTQAAISLSPTLTAQMTQAGVILGTAAYMSPEQARGENIDRRTDIWAFGVLLYELLTGTSPFAGRTVTDVIAAVVTRDPDWTALPANTPEPLARLLKRCIRKEPHERLHDIADARLELAEGLAGAEAWQAQPRAAASAPTKSALLPWSVAAVMTLVAAGLLWWGLSRSKPTAVTVEQPVWFSVTEPAPFVAPLPNSVAVSRDGRNIAYTASVASTGAPMFQLHLRRLGATRAEPIAATQTGVSPFFSPDGDRLGFFSLREGNLQIVDLRTGAVTPLVDISTARGGVWRDDDVIFYSPDTEAGIWRIDADGANNAPVTFPDADRGERSHRYPDLLPDGKTLLFTVATSEILEFDEAHIDAFDIETGDRVTVVENGSYGRYVDPGFLLYAREGSLMAIAFDSGTLATSGRSTKVVDGMVTAPLTGGADFAVSAGGTLAYFSGEPVEDPRSLVWIDRQGKAEMVTDEALPYQAATCSPDGRSLALDIDAANANIWQLELQRQTTLRLTPSRSNNSPVWTPDGERIAYSSSGGDGRRPYWQSVDGSSPPQEIPAPEGFWWPRSFTPDGQELVASLETTGGADWDIWVLPLSDDEQARPLIATKHIEDLAQVSPDGQWIAYMSDETGRQEIYLQAYPNLGSKIRLSRNGGFFPAWSHDGRELFFREPNSGLGATIMAVSIDPGPPLSAGAPVQLFEIEAVLGPFTVCPDGRFVFIQLPPSFHEVQSLDIAFGWTDTLPQLLSR